ncbi:hypothetical protein JL720_11891 [Aureococcus anophagefferens]|nr:hypothetical protein JL720_11891 [Aureococcus anophagefferens]
MDHVLAGPVKRLRRAAAALDRLSAAEPDDVSDRLSVLDSWFESQTFNDAPSAARTAVVEALVRGLDHDDLRSRLIIARETLRLLDGTVLAGDGPREAATFRAAFQASRTPANDPLFFDVKLVAVLLAALARAAQKLAPAARKEDRARQRAAPAALEPLIYAAGTIKNLTNHDGHLRPLGQLGIICTLCDLLRAAVAHHRHEEKRTVDDAPKSGADTEEAGRAAPRPGLRRAAEHLVDAAEDAATIAAETPGAEPDAGCTDFLAAARALQLILDEA